MSDDENKAESLAADLHEAASEARRRIAGEQPQKWALLPETERAVYRAMAFRALHLEDVADMSEADVYAIESEISALESDVESLRAVVGRIKRAQRTVAA